MRALGRLLSISVVLVLVAGCGARLSELSPGQSYALAPDLTVRLLSSRPAPSQLSLQVMIFPTGETSLESLVPDVVITPDGGQETSASLNFSNDRAVINMLLADAQQVQSVVVHDIRNGHAAQWGIPLPEAVLGCKPGDDCQLIGMPQSLGSGVPR